MRGKTMKGLIMKAFSFTFVCVLVFTCGVFAQEAVDTQALFERVFGGEVRLDSAQHAAVLQDTPGKRLVSSSSTCSVPTPKYLMKGFRQFGHAFGKGIDAPQ